MSKVLLINDTTNWYHYGCSATSLALKEEIISRGYQLTALPITQTYQAKSIPKNIADFDCAQVFQSFSLHNAGLINQIKNHDIIIINAEGSIHGISHASVTLLYLSYVAKKFLNKNTQIINHSVYPQDDKSLNNNLIVNIYKLVYRNLDFIAIREPISYELMSSLGIKTAALSFDCMPLYIAKYYKISKPKRPKTLVLGGSAAWMKIDILRAKDSNIKAYEQKLEQFISYIKYMQAAGYQVEFLFSAHAFPAKDDEQFIMFLQERLAQKIHITSARSLKEWLTSIQTAELVVSGRFHHTIAAYCLRTNFIALNSNTPKVEGLIKTLNTHNYCTYEAENLLDQLLYFTHKHQHTNPINDAAMLINMAKKNFSLLPTVF